MLEAAGAKDRVPTLPVAKVFHKPVANPGAAKLLVNSDDDCTPTNDDGAARS